jgi:hypothetical protein
LFFKEEKFELLIVVDETISMDEKSNPVGQIIYCDVILISGPDVDRRTDGLQASEVMAQTQTDDEQKPKQMKR